MILSCFVLLFDIDGIANAFPVELGYNEKIIAMLVNLSLIISFILV
jgi:hypothetical protein